MQDSCTIREASFLRVLFFWCGCQNLFILDVFGYFIVEFFWRFVCGRMFLDVLLIHDFRFCKIFIRFFVSKRCFWCLFLIRILRVVSQNYNDLISQRAIILKNVFGHPHE